MEHAEHDEAKLPISWTDVCVDPTYTGLAEIVQQVHAVEMSSAMARRPQA